MSYENKGTTPVTVIVTSDADGTGNFVFRAGVDDPVVTIEAALSYLNTFGGGTLITKGAGETWIFQSKCDIDTNDITWISDWSLTFQAVAALDTEMIEVTGDRVHLIRLHLDGNRANQNPPNGIQPGGIHFEDSNDFKVLDCWIHDIRCFGIWAYFIGGTPTGGEIGGCLLENCDWNGISIGTGAADYYSYEVQIHDCKIDGFGDVGITVLGYRNQIDNCQIFNGTGVLGSVNSGYAYACEGYSSGNRFSNCLAKDCKVTFYAGANAGDNWFNDGTAIDITSNSFYLAGDGNQIRDTDFYDCEYGLIPGDNNVFADNRVYTPTQSITVWTGHVKVNGDGNIIRDNEIWDGTATINIHGVFIDGGDNNTIDGNQIHGIQNQYGVSIMNDADNNDVINNSFYSCFGGIEIQDSNCDNTKVLGNVFRNVTTCLNDGGTGTILPVIGGQFVYYAGGSSGWDVTSPTGIDIDADNEYAIGHVHLPPRVHQVVRIKYWGYSNVVEAANNMLLQFLINGGSSNEQWNAENISVGNIPSQETGGIAVNDVLHWIIDASDDSDIGDLAACDYLEIWAVGEAAAAPDIATDALFGGWEIEYV